MTALHIRAAGTEHILIDLLSHGRHLMSDADKTGAFLPKCYFSVTSKLPEKVCFFFFFLEDDKVFQIPYQFQIL